MSVFARPCNPYRIAVVGALLLFGTPSVARDRGQQQPGEVAKSAVGEVGQRQAREQNQANIEPMSRINSRIANRVQNRIRNRIDRSYDPVADATSPFETAADQARVAGPLPRQ